MCLRRANPGTMLLGLLIWPNHFYQCMVSARKYPPFLVSILISDLNQNTVVSQSGPGQSTGKKWWIVPLCTDEPHSRFVTEFCHVEMCAIHYLPKESEFGRPKNKWNILDIICPKFFWSHIFISFCFFSWLFQIPSSWCLSRKKVRKKVFKWSEFHLYQSSFLQNPNFSQTCCFKISKFFTFEEGNPLSLLSLVFQAMTGKVLHIKF